MMGIFDRCASTLKDVQLVVCRATYPSTPFEGDKWHASTESSANDLFPIWLVTKPCELVMVLMVVLLGADTFELTQQ